MKSNGLGGFDPFTWSQRKAVQASLISKGLEFETFKTRVMDLLPDANEFERIAIPHPTVNQDVITELFCHIREADKVLFLLGKNGDSCPLDFDGGLTKTQFEKALEMGDKFWLYLVERAESENFNIVRIQNPGRLVNQFFTTMVGVWLVSDLLFLRRFIRHLTPALSPFEAEREQRSRGSRGSRFPLRLRAVGLCVKPNQRSSASISG